MRKTYTTHYSKLILTLERGGIKATVEFKGGRINENVPGRFITSDPLLQYLIEKDARYGSLFRLEKAVPTAEEIRARKEEEEAKEAQARSKASKPVTVVESVRDCVDAIDYFASIGKELTTEKQVKATMKAMNVQFPNWDN